MSCDVLICGLGGIGGWAVEMLARQPNVGNIVTADINEDYGRRKTNSVQYGASQFGLYPTLEFKKVDVTNVEETAQTLREVDPRVILSSMTLLTWHALTALPKDKYEMVEDAGLGPFLPAHLLLQYRLMQAIDLAGINPYVVETSFPDAVAPVLHKADCRSPDIGVGNLDNLVPAVKDQVAEKMSRNIRNVQVYLVAHHVCNVWFTRRRPDGPPSYGMKIFVRGRDLTDRFDTEELMMKTAAKQGGLRLSGSDSDSLTASSAAKHALAFLTDNDLFSHAPGPKGLVGGYPVYINRSGVELALPEGISKSRAVKINEEGQYRDGIEEIKEDGTVVFTSEASGLMKKALNYDCKTMYPDEVEGRAEELLAKFEEQSAKARC